LRKLTIPIRNSKPFQFAKVLPGRLAREIGIRRGEQLRFRYWPMTPNLDEYLTADSDAFSSMDPQAAAAFFVSRGYTDVDRTGPLARLLYGYDPVRITKPQG
jgi:hypothetical protein